MVFALAFINHQWIDGISIVGLALGVLGSLYLTYDLLDSSQSESAKTPAYSESISHQNFAKHGPTKRESAKRGSTKRGSTKRESAKRSALRWLLRILTPTLIDFTILGIAGAVVYGAFYGFTGDNIVQGVAVYGTVGVLMGLFHGLFIQWPPNPLAKRFSPRQSIIGALIFFVFWFVGGVLAFGTLDGALKEGGFLMPIGALAGGFWRFIHRTPRSREKPPILSKRGFFLVGPLAAFLFTFLTLFVVAMFLEPTVAASLRGASRAALLALIPGAISGGVSPYIFWWIDHLPKRSLGAFGVTLTLIGFLVQILPPLASLLELSGH